MCKVQIALQELRSVALVLHRMAFPLSAKPVVLHLDNGSANALVCNQGDKESPLPD